MNEYILEERKKLALEVAKQIKELGLKQREVAALAKINQPVVSDIIRGKVEKIGIEQLMRISKEIGVKVNIKTKLTDKKFKYEMVTK